MQLKIIQWNIWLEEDIRNIIRFLKKEKPDIVCVQELTTNYINAAAPKRLARALKMFHYFKAAQRIEFEGSKFPIGNGIFSRFPLKKRFFSYIQNPASEKHDYAMQKRVYIEAVVPINGKELTIGTTHMSYTHRFVVTEKKKKEVEKLVSIIKSKKNNFIFTGDMNSGPYSYGVKRVSQYLKNCGPSFDKKTWTTVPFDYEDFVTKELNWRLDYIFATKDIRVLSSKILKSDYSDHLPILTKIDF